MPNKVHPVPRVWPGETVVILASGPSLTREDVAFVRGKAKTIVVNTTYKMAPWADVLYACDGRWWRWHKGAQDFEGTFKFAMTGDAYRWGCTMLGRGPSNGLSLDPMKLALGNNGGYQAINLAVLMGATRILLLGYDMQLGPTGQQHWHADHPIKARSPYRKFQEQFPHLVGPLQKAGVEVINCSRATALECFPRMPITEALSAPAVGVEPTISPWAGMGTAASTLTPVQLCGSDAADRITEVPA